MTKSEQYVMAIYILPNKISLESSKESEETATRSFEYFFVYWQYLDIHWNESGELFRVNGKLSWRPEFNTFF